MNPITIQGKTPRTRIVVYGRKIAYGCDPSFLTSEISGIPDGSRIGRRIMREYDALKIVVRNPLGVSVHYVDLCDSGLKLGLLIAANKREPIR
jgi:hypothetical protein